MVVDDGEDVSKFASHVSDVAPHAHQCVDVIDDSSLFVFGGIHGRRAIPWASQAGFLPVPKAPCPSLGPSVLLVSGCIPGRRVTRSSKGDSFCGAGADPKGGRPPEAGGCCGHHARCRGSKGLNPTPAAPVAVG